MRSNGAQPYAAWAVALGAELKHNLRRACGRMPWGAATSRLNTVYNPPFLVIKLSHCAAMMEQ